VGLVPGDTQAGCDDVDRLLNVI